MTSILLKKTRSARTQQVRLAHTNVVTLALQVQMLATYTVIPSHSLALSARRTLMVVSRMRTKRALLIDDRLELKSSVRLQTSWLLRISSFLNLQCFISVTLNRRLWAGFLIQRRVVDRLQQRTIGNNLQILTSSQLR